MNFIATSSNTVDGKPTRPNTYQTLYNNGQDFFFGGSRQESQPHLQPTGNLFSSQHRTQACLPLLQLHRACADAEDVTSSTTEANPSPRTSTAAHAPNTLFMTISHTKIDNRPRSREGAARKAHAFRNPPILQTDPFQVPVAKHLV
jgi:hypothetical protein